jgi:hypothetical protein
MTEIIQKIKKNEFIDIMVELKEKIWIGLPNPLLTYVYRFSVTDIIL